VKSTVEPLEGNKVKVSVQVEEAEFDKELDAAFRRISQQVRLPGFRPGKAPRKVLEARIGVEYAREEAFRESLPSYYAEAVKEHDVDVIAPPEIDITAGQEGGEILFDAVVEVRPSVEVGGYHDLRVEIPSPVVSEAEVDEAVDRMRAQFGELSTVEREAAAGDRVVIDIEGSHEGEPLAGLTATDYVYEVGSNAVGIAEIDEQLTGASAGDELEFDAAHPDEDEDEPLQFRIVVKEVQELVLPEADDAWAAEASEFETLAELRADFAERMGRSRRLQAAMARRQNTAEALGALIDDELVPEAMVNNEIESRAQDFAMRLQAQGMDFEQYLMMTGRSREEISEELRAAARLSAKLDLALRALASAEGIEVGDDELEAELSRVAEQVGAPTDQVRQQLTDSGNLSGVRSDLQKSKALDWLLDRVTLVDADGNAISTEDLEVPDDEGAGDHDHTESPTTDTEPTAETEDAS
jgi:trigger factor